MCSIKTILEKAEKSIILIDSYVDMDTFRILEKKGELSEVKIYSRCRLNVPMRNLKRRKCFLSGISYTETSNFRDRYLIIDEKMMYLLTRPLRDFGKRGFQAVRIMDYTEVQRMLHRVGKNI